MSKKNLYLTTYEIDTLRDHFIIKIMLTIAIILILTVSVLIYIRVDQVCKQQIDTLDQLSYIRQALENPETQPANPVSSISLTSDERDLVCRVVMSESGDQSLQAQMAVAQTIYDRMNDFGSTLPEAIRTYSQHDNGKPTDSVRLAVANIFDGGMRVFEGGTYQFHDDSVDPYWTTGKINRGSIGNLRFYGGYEEW